MRKLIILLLLAFNVSAQDYGNSTDAMKLCSVLQTNNFGTDAEAEVAMNQILQAIGASKRFVLQPCSNINNAVATSYRGIRYILYDRDFMNSISNGNDWGNLFVLAHEIGHHINGHSVDLVLYATDAIDIKSLEERRQNELEADEFAGFVLAKLGGPLSAAVKTINSISSNTDDTYSTHPSREKRLAAVEKGYKSAESNSLNTKNDLSEEYFYKATEALQNSDYTKALEHVTVAVALNPNNWRIYTLKGEIHVYKRELILAIESYKSAIELNNEEYWNYTGVGFCYSELAGSSSDDQTANFFFEESKKFLTIAVEKCPDPNFEYYILGRSHFDRDLTSEAIYYLSKSLEIEPSDKAYFFRGLSYGFHGDNYEAIADFTNVLNITDDNEIKADAYYYRSIGKGQLGDMDGYCDDLKEANRLSPNPAYSELLNEYGCK